MHWALAILGGMMDSKAEALTAAKQRIIALQKQMSARILDMAAEVEKLTEVATEREAREFLRVTCNMPPSELSTYVGFRAKLKGYEELLETSRAQFPVVKALVAADSDTRTEVLERMAIGARIDTKEVASIRRRLKEAQLTPGQVLAKRNGRKLATAARKNLAESLTNFQNILRAFVESLMDERDPKMLESSEVREGAVQIRRAFESFFGSDHPTPQDVKPNTTAQEMALAFDALKRLEGGTFGGLKLRTLRDPGLVALLTFSGHALFEYKSDHRNVQTPPPPHHRLKVVELCAGAGGMAIGLERAGFDHVALIEYDKHAAATLRVNRPDWNVIEGDIRATDFQPYRQMDIDLVSGGIPCQPYSSDGYGLGKDDPRDLFPEAVRVISEVRPRAFLFENVDGLLHARHADHVADFLRGFKKAGYQVEIHRMKAENYGIAQERSRVLIIGLRKDLEGAFRMPPTFPGRRLNIGDALVDLMSANGWTGAHDWARARREQPILDREGKVLALGALASTIVTRRGLPREKEAARWGAKCVDIAGLPDSAPTPEQASKPGFMPALTARMRARLQDFDDDWQFSGGKQATADQIGNAVPPRLAQAVGLALFAAIKDVTWDWERILWPGAERRTLINAPPLVPERIALAELEMQP
ncbi:DNA cytosine methyltransferase [Pararhizobium sp. LjRoot235]|uniref:DNA cytosine methyltransferase n=1 Tax=Pararhizobium sp. LjRoot235 TaxID=3342291 RepID=UPI003ECE4276